MPSPPRASDALSPGWRVLLVALAAGLFAPLGVARALSPSPSGLGTHQQLGLPPCTLVALFNIRCPSCGMTTSWSLATRGRVWAAFTTNAGGLFLAVLAAAVAPWALISGLRGRWLWVTPNDRLLAAAAIAIVAVTLVDWMVRLGG